jgi:hypothetical protein
MGAIKVSGLKFIVMYKRIKLEQEGNLVARFTEYKILQASSISELETEVLDYLMDNWELAGGAVPINMGSIVYMQTLTYKEGNNV